MKIIHRIVGTIFGALSGAILVNVAALIRKDFAYA